MASFHTNQNIGLWAMLNIMTLFGAAESFHRFNHYLVTLVTVAAMCALWFLARLSKQIKRQLNRSGIQFLYGIYAVLGIILAYYAKATRYDYAFLLVLPVGLLYLICWMMVRD